MIMRAAMAVEGEAVSDKLAHSAGSKTGHSNRN
jgi:hypothetical protein